MYLIMTVKTYVDGKLTENNTDIRKWRGDGEDYYYRATSPDTLQFFRNLGGTERVTYGWTLAGKIVTKLTSTSPDKRVKTIRTFDIARDNI